MCGSVTYGGGGTILYLAAHNGIRYLFLNIQKLYTSCSGDLTQFHAAATCIKLYYLFFVVVLNHVLKPRVTQRSLSYIPLGIALMLQASGSGGAAGVASVSTFCVLTSVNYERRSIYE